MMPSHTAEFLDPASIAFRATPTIPSGSGLSGLGSAIINLPAHVVYDAILDVENFPKWTTFIRGSEIITLAPGQSETDRKMHEGTRWKYAVAMSETGTPASSNEKCVEVQPLQLAKGDGTTATTTVRWVYDVPFPFKYLLKAEHVNEITDLGDGRTEYVHWETFSGVGAMFVKATAGDYLRKKFNDWPEELKTYLEKGDTEGGIAGNNSA